MIPIMKPLLPTADKLLPYLKQIDDNRFYSNTGPLCQEYERRLSEMFDCHAVSCSSATSGLTATLMAVLPFNYKTRMMVAMPSWTFCATASAIFAAGFRPLICDVDKQGVLDTWSCGGARAFVPVMPLGNPINLQDWEELKDIFDTPVVIDGAAGFDALTRQEIMDVPVVVSTHCTKTFATGEGGFVLSQDSNLIKGIRRILNQGMLPDKSISELGFNGKMSEYHAAVGLAELDGWENKRQLWHQLQGFYGDYREYVTSTHHVTLPENTDVNGVVKAMYRCGVMCRASWYGLCHLQKAYTEVWSHDMGHDGTIKMPMKNTEELRKRTLFLPKYIGMTQEDVDYIRESLGESIAECSL